MTETQTYWHIAWDGYETGQPLRNRNDLLKAGVEVPWMWDDAEDGFDGDYICLFPDTEQGRQEADWLWYERPTYTLLKVEVPADYELSRVDEGYPAVWGNEIPAEWITIVHHGYAEGMIA